MFQKWQRFCFMITTQKSNHNSGWLLWFLFTNRQFMCGVPAINLSLFSYLQSRIFHSKKRFKGLMSCAILSLVIFFRFTGCLTKQISIVILKMARMSLRMRVSLLRNLSSKYMYNLHHVQLKCIAFLIFLKKNKEKLQLGEKKYYFVEAFNN